MDIIVKVADYLRRNGFTLSERRLEGPDGSALYLVAIDGRTGPIRVHASQRPGVYRRAMVEIYELFATRSGHRAEI